MRKVGLLIVLAILFLVCCKQNRNRTTKSGDVKVTISETGKEYRFKAYFEKEKTATVQTYIAAQTRINDLFKNYQTNKEVILSDDTKFQLKSKMGYVEMVLDKRANDDISLKSIKELSNGIKEKILAKN
ncbi:MAG: hypothetical protein Q8K64_00635 [Sediminibacterium sp.]|nr:hypothetical protein [Sediminibacterium sp.]TXT31463.1 MAG: hypothetical protein FD136_1481 [Chitinophagaceae bacterium]